LQGTISLGSEEVASACLDVSAAVGPNEFTLGFSIEEPRLWWPNGYGPQNLYESHIFLSGHANGEIIDEKRFTFGLKNVRLEPNPGLPEGLPPWCFVVNGQRIFIKGWNWVPIDNMYGGDYAARYERLIRLANEANVNLLRVWGGGVIEREVFYELCDRAGIMVWQEFPLSSSGLENDAPSDPEYLAMLRKAACHIVKSRRNYASHAVWCGGNELHYRGKDDDAMKALREVCERLDPSKPYVPTSPLRVEGAVNSGLEDMHGHWQYLGPREHYRVYTEIKPAFHSEFGAEGAANLENVESFIRDVDLWPPSWTNEIWAHRGDWWVNTHMIESMFGPIENLADFFRFSQFLQWDGLRFIVEQGRGRKFACGGTIPWQFNEPWPNLICTNAVDWYTMPKMAYYSVARAYAPVMVGARFVRLDWRPGEVFQASVFFASSVKEHPEASVDYFILDMAGQTLHGGKFSFSSPAGASTAAGEIEWQVPDGFEELFFLKLVARDATGGAMAENAYIFSAAPAPIFQSMRDLPETTLRILRSTRSSQPAPMPLHPMAALRRASLPLESVETESGEETVLTVEIVNDGLAYAFFVRGDAQEGKRDVFFEQNYLMLAPQERGTFCIKMARSVANFTFSGWNTNEVSLP